ncbi:MAG: CinA family protein [Nitrospirae bacterium]|nr:CinA family protein [Nitrospirota bacterium]
MAVKQDTVSLEEIIGRLLENRGWRLSTAESCTGGLIAHRITNISGSSEYFDGGVVTYSNEAKIDLLKVPAETIKTHGAVSSQTAMAMAEGIRRLRGTEIGIGVTGIAGPTGGTASKPVGLAYIALASPVSVECKEFRFRGERESIKFQASEAALQMIRRHLEEPIAV